LHFFLFFRLKSRRQKTFVSPPFEYDAMGNVT